MKAIIAGLAFAAGCFVSAGALYEAHAGQIEACQRAESTMLAAAQAPIRPDATQSLGFTPMDQFNKVYPPVCIPGDLGADLFSALVAGAIVSLLSYIGLSLAVRVVVR